MPAFDLPKNRFKAALAARERAQIGLWLSLGSAAATEMMADAGFDFIVVDGEHSPLDIDLIHAQIARAQLGDTPIVVRPPANEPAMIKQICDAGAQTLIVPMVDDAEQAEAAVAAAHYPPRGIRGVAGGVRASRYGRIPDYLRRANDEICVVVQIETERAVNNIDEIAAVPGVDALFIGPADLSASMGCLGRMTDPDMEKFIAETLGAIRLAGKPAGILSFDPEVAQRYLGYGADMLVAASDATLLMGAAEARRKMFE
jgi:4-hydroxy-2-oxoheptanedioate aldolase